MIKLVLFLFTIVASWQALPDAKTPNPEPYSFRRWKDHQVVEARNHVVRLTNRMHLLKTGRYRFDTEGLPLLEAEDEKLYSELKSLGDDQIAERSELEKRLLKSVEGKMQMAIENLQIAKDLTIDDYTVVYLSRYQGDGEALARLVERLTKEEVIELLQARLQAPPEGPTALPTSAPRAVGIMQLQLESSKN